MSVTRGNSYGDNSRSNRADNIMPAKVYRGPVRRGQHGEENSVMLAPAVGGWLWTGKKIQNKKAPMRKNGMLQLLFVCLFILKRNKKWSPEKRQNAHFWQTWPYKLNYFYA